MEHLLSSPALLDVSPEQSPWTPLLIFAFFASRSKVTVSEHRMGKRSEFVADGDDIPALEALLLDKP